MEEIGLVWSAWLGGLGWGRVVGRGSGVAGPEGLEWMGLEWAASQGLEWVVGSGVDRSLREVAMGAVGGGGGLEWWGGK